MRALSAPPHPPHRFPRVSLASSSASSSHRLGGASKSGGAGRAGGDTETDSLISVSAGPRRFASGASRANAEAKRGAWVASSAVLTCEERLSRP